MHPPPIFKAHISRFPIFEITFPGQEFPYDVMNQVNVHWQRKGM